MRAIVLLLLPLIALAQTQVDLSEQSRGTLPAELLPAGVKQIPSVTVATLPASPEVDDLVVVTDCEAEFSCTAGGGSLRKILVWTGTEWKIVGDGSGATVAVERNDSTVTTSADTFDFSSDFSVSESPAGEANVLLNRPSVRYAHRYATGGSGTSNDPWRFASGNPIGEAVANGGTTVFFVPGHYRVRSCPSIIPGGVSVIGWSREETVLKFDCHAVKNRVAVSGASNASPIVITTSSSHGLETGDWVNITGVTGNTAANGDWEVTVTGSTTFELVGSSGNGNFVNASTGMWAGEIFPIANVNALSPIQVDTQGSHNFVTGDLVYIEGVSGLNDFKVNGARRPITVVDADSFTIDDSARQQSTLSGGTVRAIQSVAAIETATDARGVTFRGFSLTNLGETRAFLGPLVGFRANESVLEEIQGTLLGQAPFDKLRTEFPNARSASITFTGNATPGETITLTQTGGGSRASSAYPAFTVPSDGPHDIEKIDSNSGSAIKITLTSNTAWTDGSIVEISSTTETVNAGAAGVFTLVHIFDDRFELVGSTGTGTSCTAGCGGATATEVEVNPQKVASGFASHLNAESAFDQDYYAAVRSNTIHLQERRYGAFPSTFSVSSTAPHTTTGWSATNQGGAMLVHIRGNSFSSRFSRIFCPGVYANFHCIALIGINNQHSIRDWRLSGANNAGWGIRTSSGSAIQNIDMFNGTVEASYGGIEIAGMTASSIRTLYMEGSTEYSIIVDDPVGRPDQGANSFTHGISISNGILLGNLELRRAKAVTVSSVVAPGQCVMWRDCEDCLIQSSYLNGCSLDSPRGHIEATTFLGKGSRPIDRYGEALATPNAALLGKKFTNFILQSDDLTASPWSPASHTSLTTGTNPFGQSELIARATVASPTKNESYNVSVQTVSGLAPNATYGGTFWFRVLTPGASCLIGNTVFFRFTPDIGESDGWVRLSGIFTADGAGSANFNPKCTVQESGLAEIAFEIWGPMVHERQTGGALPPYIPTGSSAVAVGPGIYLERDNFYAPTSAATFAPGGSAVACKAYVVRDEDLTAASSTEDVTLFTLPSRGKLTGVTVKHSESFAGSSLTGMTVSVGDSSSSTAYTSAFDVFQGVSDSAFQDTPLFKSTTAAARDVRARFTASGGNTADATAGRVEISACWMVVP